MICTKCKRKLVDTSKYCPRCGYLFPSNDVKKFSYGIDEGLMNYYIKDYRINSFFGINLFYFFSSFYYAFLKKMYTVGVYSFIKDVTLVFLIKYGMYYVFKSIGFYFLAIFFMFLVCIFTHFYYSFKFNDLFIQNILERISKFEKIYYKDDLNIMKACESDCKNNYIFAFASIVLFLIVLLFI